MIRTTQDDKTGNNITSDNPNIFLNMFAVPGPNPAATVTVKSLPKIWRPYNIINNRRFLISDQL